jgi:hypothetical protein
MGFGEEFQQRFGGLWNTIFLILLVVVCLRFAGAEWTGAPLRTRLLVALYLFLGCVGCGIIFALSRIIVALSEPSYSRPSTPESIVWGLKYGAATGMVLLILAGILLVKDFLTPLLDLLSKVLEPILHKI